MTSSCFPGSPTYFQPFKEMDKKIFFFLKRIITMAPCNANVWRDDLFTCHSHGCWEMTTYQRSSAFCKDFWSVTNGWGNLTGIGTTQRLWANPASKGKGKPDQESFVQRVCAVRFSCQVTHYGRCHFYIVICWLVDFHHTPRYHLIAPPCSGNLCSYGTRGHHLTYLLAA